MSKDKISEIGEELGFIVADDANLKAIATYVQSKRPLVDKFPKLLPAIQQFEKWYSGLGYYDTHIVINDTMKEAYRQRNEINTILGDTAPEDVIPADTNIQDNEPGSTHFQAVPDKPKEPLIPEKYKVGLAVGGGAVVAFTVLRFLSSLTPAGLLARATRRRR